MYYIDSEDKQQDRLGFEFLLAAALHALLILGVGFNIDSAPEPPTRQLDVTLTTVRSTQAPEEAEFLAEADQVGSGADDPRSALSTTKQSQISAAELRELSGQRLSEPVAQSTDAPVITTSRPSDTRVSNEEVERTPQPDPLPGLNPELQQLSQDIASLQAQLDRQNEMLSKMPRVRRITALSAKKAEDAAYLQHWRSRVEAIGNQYYPEASRRYGIYGELRMLVVIRKDGTLENLEILSSSGHTVLDEAALKIVRMAAPFAPFPKALADTTDKLEIVRTWQFQENGLSSG